MFAREHIPHTFDATRYRPDLASSRRTRNSQIIAFFAPTDTSQNRSELLKTSDGRTG